MVSYEDQTYYNDNGDKVQVCYRIIDGKLWKVSECKGMKWFHRVLDA
jgi:hypothetical protein